MSSILTNVGAQVALSTLTSISNDLGDTQKMITTGQAVATADDNAALWAISKTMSSDVSSYRTISQSLSLGQSTLGVARNGAEAITDLLIDMKDNVVAAQEQNVDRSKLQTKIEAITAQIDGIAKSAQFNGLNLLQISGEEGSGSVAVLSSLDRKGTSIQASDITVRRRDLTTDALTIPDASGTYTASVGSVTVDDTTREQTSTTPTDLAELANTAGTDAIVGLQFTSSGALSSDAGFDDTAYSSHSGVAPTQAEFAAGGLTYGIKEGDTAADVARGLQRQFDIYAGANNIDRNIFNIEASGDDLKVTYGGEAGGSMIVTYGQITDAELDEGGGLAELSAMDVTTDEGAARALFVIEEMIDYSTEVAAEYGSVGMRLDTQAEFISGLTDQVRAGIGALVDANMEEVSARLQALQVQEQLGIQALSIANQAPQSILSLFR